MLIEGTHVGICLVLFYRRVWKPIAITPDEFECNSRSLDDYLLQSKVIKITDRIIDSSIETFSHKKFAADPWSILTINDHLDIQTFINSSQISPFNWKNRGENTYANFQFYNARKPLLSFPPERNSHNFMFNQKKIFFQISCCFFLFFEK